MFKNFRGYLPEFVLMDKLDENGKLVGYELISLLRLDVAHKKVLMKHEKSAHNVDNRPLYKRVILGSTSIMRYGGSYDANSFKFVVEHARKLGYKIMPLFRDIHGGGQAAKGWGIVHVSAVDHMGVILAEMGIAEEFYKLPPAKQLNRINKLFGSGDSFRRNISVMLVSDSPNSEGIAHGHPDWMAEEGIPYGAKLTGPVKCLVVPMNIPIKGVDLILPMGENKLGLTVEKLSRLIRISREASPEFRYSKNLPRVDGKVGRYPTNAYDLQAILNRTPNPDLSIEKLFYETGRLDEKLFSAMFEYTDKKSGEKKLRREGSAIKAGTDPFDPSIKVEVMKALWTVITGKLRGRIPGIYGVAMPLDLLPKDVPIKYGWISRWPWALPIYGRYAIFEHCIFVSTELMKLFGGDYDGDLIAVYHKKSMNTTLSMDKDYAQLVDWMKAPDKIEDLTERSMGDTIIGMLGQYSGCGKVFNAGKVVVDAARMDGWSNRRILELEARIYASIVQPFIDGFKYAGTDKVPTAVDIAVKFGVPTTNIKRIQAFFIAIRTSVGGVDLAIETAVKNKVDSNSKSYYERVCAVFSSWKPRQ